MVSIGYVLWIIRWQLEQIIARSFSSVLTSPSDFDRGRIWWTSQNPSPRSPYTFLKSKPQTSQHSFPVALRTVVFLDFTIAAFRSRLKWATKRGFPSWMDLLWSTSGREEAPPVLISAITWLTISWLSSLSANQTLLCPMPPFTALGIISSRCSTGSKTALLAGALTL